MGKKLRKAAFVIAYVDIFWYFMIIVAVIVKYNLLRRKKHVNKGFGNGWIFGGILCFSTIQLLVSSLLLYGICEKKHKYMVPWISVNLLITLITCLAMIWNLSGFFVLSFKLSNFTINIFILCIFIIRMFCITDYYREIVIWHYDGNNDIDIQN